MFVHCVFGYQLCCGVRVIAPAHFGCVCDGVCVFSFAPDTVSVAVSMVALVPPFAPDSVAVPAPVSEAA